MHWEAGIPIAVVMGLIQIIQMIIPLLKRNGHHHHNSTGAPAWWTAQHSYDMLVENNSMLKSFCENQKRCFEQQSELNTTILRLVAKLDRVIEQREADLGIHERGEP